MSRYLQLAIALLFLSLTGCSLLPDSNPATSSAGRAVVITPGTATGSAVQPIAKVAFHGGECEAALCERAYTIFSDGLVELAQGGTVRGHRIADAADLASLQALLTPQQVAQLKQQPFQGTCPTAVDGQERSYTIYLATGPEEIAECTYTIPANQPLIVALQGFVQRYDIPAASAATPASQPTVQLPLEDQEPIIQVTFAGGICPNGESCRITHTFTRDTISQAGGTYILEAYKLPSHAWAIDSNDFAQLQDLLSKVTKTTFDPTPREQRCALWPADALIPTYTFFTPQGQIVYEDCPLESERTQPIIHAIDLLIDHYSTQTGNRIR